MRGVTRTQARERGNRSSRITRGELKGALQRVEQAHRSFNRGGRATIPVSRSGVPPSPTASVPRLSREAIAQLYAGVVLFT